MTQQQKLAAARRAEYAVYRTLAQQAQDRDTHWAVREVRQARIVALTQGRQH